MLMMLLLMSSLLWFPEATMHKDSPHKEPLFSIQKLHTDIAALFCCKACCRCLCFQVFCAEEVAQGAISSLVQVVRNLLFRPQPAQQQPLSWVLQKCVCTGPSWSLDL